MNKLALLTNVLARYPSELAMLRKLAAPEKTHHDKLKESGRWDISEPTLSESGWGSKTEYTYKPKGIEGWKSEHQFLKDPDTGWQGPGRERFWNPDIADLIKTEDKWGTDISSRPKAGWIEEIPQNDSLIYRGISFEEMEYINRTGIIQSDGSYNLGDEQIGLTYFTTQASSGKSYAHSFAPNHMVATPNKPAYVIAVDKRPGKAVAGTGEHEVGIVGSIPASEIKEVWIGEPYYISSMGSFSTTREWNGEQDGYRSGPSISVAWRRIK